MSEEPQGPIDPARYAKLAERHVYGDPKRRPGGRAPWFKMTSSASIGIEIAVAVVGCTLVARWIEVTYTHWAPWTTLIGFSVGIAASVKALMRTARQYQREIADREREQALTPGDDQAGPGAAP
ncbi:AtpZ/AtpI family protein [Enhygromyxa salina]|uniref:Putative F0F1-ATPase subunit n=1 Tax=Enhygromyxa salina TaxID=215803 RepID=A0A2S9YC47_9BACT|nr:AtpZ/AtpI family protein [Enhygromyxa salina]PRQ02687.1 putative F0F1-ATPase subunit [Enhygromyxa salina]